MKKRSTRWSKWKRVGEIELDTATILFADPCQVIPSDCDIQNTFNGDWHKFLDATIYANQIPAPDPPKELSKYELMEFLSSLRKWRRRKPKTAHPVLGRAALCVSTGADGIYRVEVREKGNRKEIRIRC